MPENKRPLREIEKEFLKADYVSPRMISTKVQLHYVTIRRMINSGQLESIVHGQQAFVPIASVKRVFGPGTDFWESAKVRHVKLNFDKWDFPDGVDTE